MASNSPANSQKKLMLLDSASLYYRAFFGVPSNIKAPDGRPVNAVRGLMDFIARLVGDFAPTDLVAAWDDDWRPQWRVDLVPSYKEHRVQESVDGVADGEEVPDDLAHQVEVIYQVLQAAGICIVGAPGFEADDVIGTMTHENSGPTLVVTGDRDLFQLVNDAVPVKVLYTAAKGVAQAEVVTDSYLYEKYGVHASQYVEFALLRGDASDGLPGVRGIGEKTAAKLLAQFGTIEELYVSTKSGDAGFTPAMTKKLLDGEDYIARARTVVEVSQKVPVPAGIETKLPSEPADTKAFDDLIEKWGLSSSATRLGEALNW